MRRKYPAFAQDQGVLLRLRGGPRGRHQGGRNSSRKVDLYEYLRMSTFRPGCKSRIQVTSIVEENGYACFLSRGSFCVSKVMEASGRQAVVCGTLVVREA